MMAGVESAIDRGVRHLVSRQGEDGSWRGDYGGPMFLLPMYVISARITRHRIDEGRRAGMIAYLCSVQNSDGSIGLHAEGPGSVFTSVLSYVALRLLGVPPGEPRAARLREWFRSHGTALAVAPWGKLMLALLNLYDYEGLHPILPELWLLPEAAPIHPGRLWCHCRQVYLPMAWLYGRRARIPEDDLIRALREELYGAPYHSIRFREHRDTSSMTDSYSPPRATLRLANRAMGLYERLQPLGPRLRSLDSILQHIVYEDRSTSFIRIGPVNAVLNTLVHHFRGEEGRADLERSQPTLDQYLWEAEDGVKMNGYNSCALWDTAFAVQAILASPAAAAQRAALDRAHGYIRDNQVLEDVPQADGFYRHRSRGGWPFSDRQHGWPITDCTSEGLKCALALEGQVPQPVPEELLAEAVRLILSFQNDDGGWATYERKRGSRWLERLNPSQVFGDIMVDYSYVECTSACIQALTRARRRFPGRFDSAIGKAIARGERFIRRSQREDGSWEGSWAVCFTYGAWFGVWGLRAAGAPPSDPAVVRACRFLLEKQREDGGWGEDGSSCRERRYIQHESQAAQTAWALLALVRAGQGRGRAAERAAAFLAERQLANGDWPRESLVGVFNKTALINYENYRRYFPVWALSCYLSDSRS